VPVPTPPGPPFRDTNGDNFVTPGDALPIINFLNQQNAGEGESATQIVVGVDTARLDSASISSESAPARTLTLDARQFGLANSRDRAEDASDAPTAESLDAFFGGAESERNGAAVAGERGSSAGRERVVSTDDLIDALAPLIDELAATSDADDRDALFGLLGS
jgi:hypothetical protein